MNKSTKSYIIVLSFILMLFAFLWIFLQTTPSGRLNPVDQKDRDIVSDTSFTDDELKKKIGQMIMIGFRGVSVDKNSEIVKIIQDLNIGGGVLYDILFHFLLLPF